MTFISVNQLHKEMSLPIDIVGQLGVSLIQHSCGCLQKRLWSRHTFGTLKGNYFIAVAKDCWWGLDDIERRLLCPHQSTTVHIRGRGTQVFNSICQSCLDREKTRSKSRSEKSRRLFEVIPEVITGEDF